MAFTFTSLTDLERADFDSIVDVRSPSEYAEDHVPGAISLPVLSDSERAEVGTIYTRVSPFKARKIGAALVAKNAAQHLQGPLADKLGSWRPLVYCWRGGQRSGSFAAILAQIGWRVEVLEGGYQSYRRRVVDALYERAVTSKVVLLDGNTGSGKTDVLQRLAARGVQVLDLEGLAEHRGSVLGGFGEQPSQKAFETGLYQAIEALDPTLPVVVEAESSRIGALNVTPKLFEAMRAAPRIVISAPVSARAAFLARTYGDGSVDRVEFVDRLGRLVDLRGAAQVEAWKAGVMAGEFEAVAASLIELHYDPRYAKVRERIGAEAVTSFSADTLDEAGLETLADQVAAAVKALPEADPTSL
ncbi:MAG: tRNA 2-selenouridine(34) synthase MnmH [Boseongicola sp.]|nr:tRNA 2-selenouridine(34) synthase MnmH [Boseongicola sp.]